MIYAIWSQKNYEYICKKISTSKLINNCLLMNWFSWTISLALIYSNGEWFEAGVLSLMLDWKNWEIEDVLFDWKKMYKIVFEIKKKMTPLAVF